MLATRPNEQDLKFGGTIGLWRVPLRDTAKVLRSYEMARMDSLGVEDALLKFWTLLKAAKCF